MARTDEDRLHLFVERVDKLADRRAVREGTIGGTLTISFTPTGGSVQHDQGDEEDLRSLLLELRRFLAPKEDVFFNRICNILERALDDQELLECNRTNRASWRDMLNGNFVAIINDRRYDGDGWLDLVLNGDLFHDDEERSAQLKALDPATQAIARHEVTNIAIVGVKVLLAARNLVKEAFTRGCLRFE